MIQISVLKIFPTFVSLNRQQMEKGKVILLTGASSGSGFDTALMLAGLTAQGTTVLTDTGGHLMRGYDHLEQKLQALGASVQRLPDRA